MTRRQTRTRGRPGGLPFLLPRLAAVAFAAACVSTAPHPGGGPAPQNQFARVRSARLRQAVALRRLFRHAGVAYPPRLLLVAYKRERLLELWGYSAKRRRYVEVKSYRFLGTSGHLGPKRRAWDHQIPEGFYRVSALNPLSLYHLSLKLDYPNASDRILGDRGDPGGDIFIHGDRVSDGCIPIGDPAIEQLYLAVLDSRAAGFEVPVDIFPCRFSDPACRSVLRREERSRERLAAFWAKLEEGYALLERSGAAPVVEVGRSGQYVFAGDVREAREVRRGERLGPH
jgi:murein L,D-transpeptidase YafK